MNKIIKSRLIELGRKQVELISELEKRGILTNPSELSYSINGKLNTPKGTLIRNECLKILDEWEKEATT